MREFDAIVTRVDGSKVYLDATAFHPRPSGGLDADTGFLYVGSAGVVRVVDTVVDGDDVAHVVDDVDGIVSGVRVHGVIDWERRYAMMRLHTAAHVVAGIVYRGIGARITGSYISSENARMDFEISRGDWRELLKEAVEEANSVLSKCIDVKVYWLPRDQALSIPGIVKLADKLPPGIDVLRVVEIPGVDIQADGAPHVKNTCEVGGIRVLKLENRGRRRKRLYFVLAAT